jgi:hypothetical protein
MNVTATPPDTSSAIDPGCLPAWGRAELPEAPPFNLRNAFKLIGPAAIALGTAIGSGEWLLGPAVTAKYGAALLWVATLSILLQVILNQEMMRYTLATGEPIFTGFLRTKPGPGFWTTIYTSLLFLQLGFPGWALAGATAIAAAFKGSLTTDADRPTILLIGYCTFLVCILIIAVGGKIEKTLERVEWAMIAWILGFLLLIGLFFTSWKTWKFVTLGFLGQGGRLLPDKTDWMLLASFAAYAGMGGLGNGTITNWVREKGWGMAATVGHISGIIGGKVVPLSQVGNTFEPTPENRSRFKEWMRYVRFEQAWVFGAGCFLGMGLPALMTIQFVPANADVMKGWATAVYQAQGIATVFGGSAWFLTLMTGFWILFSTQLGNIDIFARTVTDMAWSANPKIQAAAKQDVRRVYFTVLIAFAVFGCWAIRLAQPGALILLGACIACFNFAIMGTHVLVVQRKFLPKELRMPLWREIAISIFILAFVAFIVLGIWSKWADISKLFGG